MFSLILRFRFAVICVRHRYASYHNHQWRWWNASDRMCCCYDYYRMHRRDNPTCEYRHWWYLGVGGECVYPPKKNHHHTTPRHATPHHTTPHHTTSHRTTSQARDDMEDQRSMSQELNPIIRQTNVVLWKSTSALASFTFTALRPHCMGPRMWTLCDEGLIRGSHSRLPVYIFY